MQLFQKCSSNFKKDFLRYAIDQEITREIARRLYVIEKRKAIDPGSIEQALLVKIDDYLKEKARRLVLVTNAQAKSSHALKRLVEEEILHQLPSAVMPRAIRDKFKAFHIDYGNYIDWFSSKRDNLEATLDDSVIPTFPDGIEEFVHDYCVDLTGLLENSLYCSNCRNTFSANHPVYEKFHVCPGCSERMPETGAAKS